MSLEDFEGLPVVGSAIEIPNAAGGFREALEIDPLVFHHGDETYATFRLRCRKVRFDEKVEKKEPTGEIVRVHVFDAISATFVDPEQAQADLDAQAERIRLAKEGPSLFDSGDEAADLASEHDAGEHRELVDDCPECRHEVELVEAGE